MSAKACDFLAGLHVPKKNLRRKFVPVTAGSHGEQPAVTGKSEVRSQAAIFLRKIDQLQTPSLSRSATTGLAKNIAGRISAENSRVGLPVRQAAGQ